MKWTTFIQSVVVVKMNGKTLWNGMISDLAYVILMNLENLLKKKKKETAKIMLNTTANNAICSKMLQL